MSKLKHAAGFAAAVGIATLGFAVGAGPAFAFGVEADPPLHHAQPARLPARQRGDDETSPWVELANPPAFDPGTMLLASDGTVLFHNEPETGGTSEWFRLTPNAEGSYADGTWSKIASMPAKYDPLYFASAILPNGQMIVEGGEYLGGEDAWTNKGAIYNPVKNTWRSVAPPPGWANIGDAQSDVLANGTFMLAQACQECLSSTFTLPTSFALFNQTTRTWLPMPGTGKNDPNDEEGWTLEPNGQLLTVDTWLTPTTELFTPTSLTWSFAGNTPTSPVNTTAVEIGPQIELPGGNTFVVGAGGSSTEAPEPCTTKSAAATALYEYAGSKWLKGPKIPTVGGLQYDSADGPGVTLPDGNALFDTSPCVYSAPLAFDLYEAGSRKIVPAPNVPNAENDSTYYTRLLMLPNGQALFDDGSSHIELYTAGGTPNPAWAPSVSSISTTTLTPGKTASLSGTQLAGLDQGAAYGDDVQDNTNFPIVRLTNEETGVVTYARTANWTSVSVAPGAASSTQFTLPSSTPTGASSLVVVANGIASAPVPVTVK
jgi:hypothetical protein